MGKTSLSTPSPQAGTQFEGRPTRHAFWVAACAGRTGVARMQTYVLPSEVAGQSPGSLEAAFFRVQFSYYRFVDVRPSEKGTVLASRQAGTVPSFRGVYEKPSSSFLETAKPGQTRLARRLAPLRQSRFCFARVKYHGYRHAVMRELHRFFMRPVPQVVAECA